LILKNNIIELEIQQPGECYKNARFDWTGQIVQITFGGKTFCTNETQNPDELNILGRGLYNEFGIDEAVGYKDCTVGDKFLKIGVGWLIKDSKEAYNFFKTYQIDPAETQTFTTNDSVTYISQVKPYRGYGYKLTKKIELAEATFCIKYSLQNTGEKTIITNEYMHNFLSINNNKIDGNYSLKFPFQLSKAGFGEFVNPNEVLSLETNTITWKENPTNQFFISNLQISGLNNAFWVLEHAKEEIGIKESTNFQILRINLWGSKHVVSPEIFYEINLLPDDTENWERHYQLFSVSRDSSR